MPNSIGPIFGSITPVPRTPDTQHDASTRGGTRDLSQQVAFVLSVIGYENAQARQR